MCTLMLYGVGKTAGAIWRRGYLVRADVLGSARLQPRPRGYPSILSGADGTEQCETFWHA